MARLVVGRISVAREQAMREILEDVGISPEHARDIAGGLIDGTSQLAVTDFEDPPVRLESLSSHLEATGIRHELNRNACF